MFKEDQELVFVTDQLSAAIRDVFIENGLDVDVSVGVKNGESMSFRVETKNGADIDPNIVNEILNEAVKRV